MASQRAMMESLWQARQRSIRLNEEIARVDMTLSARLLLYLPTPDKRVSDVYAFKYVCIGCNGPFA